MNKKILIFKRFNHVLKNIHFFTIRSLICNFLNFKIMIYWKEDVKFKLIIKNFREHLL